MSHELKQNYKEVVDVTAQNLGGHGLIRHTVALMGSWLNHMACLWAGKINTLSMTNSSQL